MRTERLDINPPAAVHLFDGSAESAAGIEAFLRRPLPYVAIDTETTGVGWGDVVRTVQIGDSEDGWVIPAAFDQIIAHVVRSVPKFIAWNMAFDAVHLSRVAHLPFDTVIAKMRDTAVLAGVLDPRAEHQGGVGRGLKPWAVRLCGEGAGVFEDERKRYFRKAGVSWQNCDWRTPVLVRYAGSDPVLTYRVHRALADQLEDRRGVVQREQRLARIAARMRNRGIAISEERAVAVFTDNRRLFAADSADLKVLGVRKVGSSRQVERALRAEGFGHQLTKKTDTGNVSVDAEVLKACAIAGSEVARRVQTAKLHKKLADDYAYKFLEAGSTDGRVHASIRTIGAKTAPHGRRPAATTTGSEEADRDPLDVRPCTWPNHRASGLLPNGAPTDGKPVEGSPTDSRPRERRSHLRDARRTRLR